VAAASEVRSSGFKSIGEFARQGDLPVKCDSEKFRFACASREVGCFLACLIVGFIGVGIAAAAEITTQPTDPTILARAIDAEIQKKLDENKVPVSPQAEDAEFLRRVYLDITGRIATLDQTNAFLANSETDKRAKLIDELLARPEYGRDFATIWRDLLVDRSPEMGRARDYSWKFVDWLAEGFNRDRGWNETVKAMLTAEGAAVENPATLFILANVGNDDIPRAENITRSIGKLFMGMQIACAQCHNHPFVKEWKQDDFWGIAAFFGQIRDHTFNGNGGSPKPTYSEKVNPDAKKEAANNRRTIKQGLLPPVEGPRIAIPSSANPTQTLRVVPAKFFLGNTPTLDEKGPYRPAFAEWLTSRDNPYFARASANRLWAHFFGRGFAAPLDNFSPGNPPSNPQALALLEKEFTACGFDQKHLIRVICNTRAYQRTSRPLKENKADGKFCSHMALRQLTADQMSDSLNVVLGRKISVNKDRDNSTAIFATKDADDSATEFSHGIPQFLYQMNSGAANVGQSFVNRFTKSKNKAECIRNLYLGILSRPPRPKEVEYMLDFLEKSKTPQDGYYEMFWALINSAEFMFNR
jgi:hypothetical protein